jgi:PAS domain-containing protein
MNLADICARKAAIAIERAAAEEAALESERRFRTVIEASTVPFIILEPVRDASDAIVDFRCNYVNTEAAFVLGHSPEEPALRRTCAGCSHPGHWNAGDERYEVARCIRATPRGTPTLLVALTGGQEKDRRESRAAGFDHHLTKPIEPAAITELVARMPRARAATS